MIKRLFVISFIIISCFMSCACFSKVEAGYVGVKVYLLGTDKGVDNEVLTPGWYWIGWNQELYKFPTFQQTVLWDGDKQFNFQTKEGMVSNVDVSISYTINKEKVAVLFQTYRKGVDEITDVYLRNIVRDSINQCSSTMTVEEAYGERKQELQEAVTALVREKMGKIGINIDFIAFVGGVKPPSSVVEAINAKVEAKQRAQQRENEIAEAEAQAKKQEALALGNANAEIQQAKGRAEAILIESEAQAKANHVIANSVTQNLIDYEKVKKWDGVMPRVSGGSQPIIDMRENK